MAFSRAAGILLHPTSLPGGHGIGDLGESAYTFVDFLHRSGIRLWQMLPLGPANSTNSPYQAQSSFAGNPLLISLGLLVEEGLLQPTDIEQVSPSDSLVDFDLAARVKNDALTIAHKNFSSLAETSAPHIAYQVFCRNNAGWLDDFALYMAAKKHHHGKAWFQWEDKGLVSRNPETLAAWHEMLAAEVQFERFCQYCFYSQWSELKRYANENGIQLIGDVPIYTAHDSADVWAAPRFFDVDEDGQAVGVAGCPPDYFCPDGQLWGNPLYHWDVLKADGYKWWIERTKAVLTMVDRIRIDHFRGFEAYWAVPATEKTARNGVWIKGPGREFFDCLKNALGDLPIIAEDLGVITPEVDALRTGLKLPGMKILQFAFGPGAEAYLPHMYETNCVVFTGTHDNDTSLGWYAAEGADYAHMDPEMLATERDKFRRYVARDGSDVAWDLIRMALGSVADTAIIPMQDILGLGNGCRMNRPGTGEGQWGWRMTSRQLQEAPAHRLRELIDLFDRHISESASEE